VVVASAHQQHCLVTAAMLVVMVVVAVQLLELRLPQVFAGQALVVLLCLPTLLLHLLPQATFLHSFRRLAQSKLKSKNQA
jgi:hypothetical protein